MDKLKNGDIVYGKVTGIEKYGIFLSLDNNMSGLIHISEISNSFVKNVNDYVNFGETIKAEVIAVDETTEKIKLSIKNIDYRVEKAFSGKIKETGTGFGILEKKLGDWISEYKWQYWHKKL